MNQTKTIQNNRLNRILSLLNSPTFRYQHTLILLIFVSATLIFLDFGVFSASFIFGLSLIALTLTRTPRLLKPRGLMWYLFAFLVIAFISLLFSELPLTSRHFKLYIQTIYWFLLAVIVYNLYPFINKRKLSKYVLYSVLLLLVLYVVGLKVGTQNGVAFTVIILAPLGYFYIRNFWYKAGFAGLLFFLMLLNGSRSGAIISFIQSGLIILLSVPKLNKYFKTITIVLVLFVALFTTDTMLETVGSAVYPYNDRLGELMMNTEYVLRNDVSWLQREAQVQKGKQIFAEQPILGIGYTNFVEYDINIDQSKIESDRAYIRNVDNRSAHNTYVAVLSETGLLGLSVVILFIIGCIISFWKSTAILGNTFEAMVFVSFIGLIIYFYTVSAFMGTSTWIVFGLIAGAAMQVNKRIKSNKKNTFSKVRNRVNHTNNQFS